MASVKAYRLKTERAKRHIREISEEIEAFKALNPYSVVIEDEPDTGKRLWKVKVNHVIPDTWSAIIGDAIHNTRAALDLLMVAIVHHCDPNRASYSHVHFVIRECRKKFESALGENIKGASPKARRVIENLKPYKGGDDAFWRLHRLDILDKHQALIPVGGAHVSLGIPFETFGLMADPDTGEGFRRARSIPGPTKVIHARMEGAGLRFPLNDGTILLANPYRSPQDDKLEFVFDVAFGQDQVVDGDPVGPALTQMVEFVEGVFDIVEQSILK